MARDTWLLTLFLIFMLLISTGCHKLEADVSATVGKVTIVIPRDATAVEDLAAREVRRYLYLRTGKLLPIVQCDKTPLKTDLVFIGQKNRSFIEKLINKDAGLRCSVASLEPQQYRMKTLNPGKQRVIVVTGGDYIGTLYGAYRFIELFGVRFFLHGDTIPDTKVSLNLPDVDEVGKPLFNLRGILPFHDFPEGPDWWTSDDFKSIVSQIVKMRMNFIGLHTYFQAGLGSEPTVWIGLPQDCNEDGTVKASDPTSWQNTQRGTADYAYAPKKTSQFSFGGSEIFETDDFGPEVMENEFPTPQTPERCNALINRVGFMLRDVFDYARKLGIKTCVGTELPLRIPAVVQERLKTKGRDTLDLAEQLYKGVFLRIMRTHSIDYYWLWTPELWTEKNVGDEQVQAAEKDILTAFDVAKEVNAPFTLATCGWVLGPLKDPAKFDSVLPKEMPFSCINRWVGRAPVSPKFADVKGRPKWAIPWLEDDPGLTSPQLWVGRTGKNAVDALKYGCTGLMGIHWRTRILGPNVSALAQAGWNQNGWKRAKDKPAKPREPIEVVRGKACTFADAAVEGTEDDTLYQDLRYKVSSYRLVLPNGKYSVKLQFQEPSFDEKGKRVFGVKIQGKTVIDRLDIFAEVGKNKALDYTFENTAVADSVLEIDFVRITDGAVISGIVVEGQGTVKKINCGGKAYKDYIADPEPLPDDRWFIPTDDFYLDWAVHQFGSEFAEEIAAIFVKIDSRMPEPSRWYGGPGVIGINDRPWSNIKKNYAFVDKLAALQPKIKGEGNKERFDYWLNSFRYMKAMARLGCARGELDKVIKQRDSETDPAAKQTLAKEKALKLRKQLVCILSEMYGYLLATLTNTSEMGTVANIEQQSMLRAKLLTVHDERLEKLLGEPLPADTKPWKDYRGPNRVIVPTVRSNLRDGEDLKLKVIILNRNQAENSIRSAALYWRPMGKGGYNRIPLIHITRGVYSVTILAEKIKSYDLEYHIKVRFISGQQVYFPVTAPKINQTVVAW